MSVGTSTSMSVHVSCIKVEPVSSERTQYDVADVSGTVQVAARKNDVNITVGGAGGARKKHIPKAALLYLPSCTRDSKQPAMNRLPAEPHLGPEEPAMG